MHKKGLSLNSVEKFLSHSADKIRRRTLLWIRKFRVSKNFMHQRGGGVPRFCVENFLSHSTEKFRWGTLRCIRKFRVSKNYMHQRGAVSRSPSKIFCHPVPKNFVGEHFGVSENFLYRKILCIRRGYH